MKSKRASSPITTSAISSLASASGRTLFDAQDGQTIEESGQGLVPASRSPQPGRGKERQTSGISGQRGSVSSRSAALTRSLANKLAEEAGRLGSTMFALTWIEQTTSRGYLVCRLAASARRISERGCSSWPTPMSTDDQRGQRSRDGKRGASPVELMAGWRSPRMNDYKGGVTGESGSQRDPANYFLADQVSMLTPWATPKASDGSGGRTTMTDGGGNAHLDIQARSTASGETPNGSPVEMGRRGQLNPELPRWLMGLPREWDDCAATATPSSRRSQKRS